MLHKENPDYNRSQFGFYSLDDLVPQDHLLRQIEEAIDFSFIYDLVADSYSLDMGTVNENFCRIYESCIGTET